MMKTKYSVFILFAFFNASLSFGQESKCREIAQRV